MQPDRIMKTPEVLHVVGDSSRTTLWRWEKAGKFPSRVQLGENSVGWRQSEVMKWLESRPRVNQLEAEGEEINAEQEDEEAEGEEDEAA